MSIIGIVEVHSRHYCCGAWSSKEHFLKGMEAFQIKVSEVEPSDIESDFAEFASRAWVCTLPEEYHKEDNNPLWLSEEDSFFAYGFDGEFPGFVGFSED